MKQNRIDDRLEKRTKKKSSYPNFSEWNEYQSLLRDPLLTKLFLIQLDKQYKKLFKNWSDFWDLCLDTNPRYCFICGYYMIPKMRNDKDRIKMPYKRGDPVHSYCFTKESTVERMTGKLNPESELICFIEKGWSISGSVCRLRVKNTVEAIRNHLGEFHSKEFTHEGNLEFLRAIYFLKPNGKSFQLRREWQ